jgi:hypothetical protein
MAEFIKHAGQVIVDQVTITTATGFTQPVLNQVAGIQIFEDIFSPFISGNIVFYDSLDLTSLFPFTGEETVRIKVHTPSFEGKNRVIDQTFYIYKLSDRETVNQSTVIYRLHFISMEAIVDLNKKMSQCFEGRCSDIVKNIVQKGYGLQSDKQANIESTPNGIKFISNYWSPVRAINYVADRSVNLKNSPTYLFFENRNGLNFISLDTLYKAPALYNFTQGNKSRDFRDDGSSVVDMDNDMNNILDISVPEGFDYMTGILDGMYASRQISFDPVTKKYTVKNFDMLSDFRKNNHLNDFPITSKKVIRKNNSTILITPKDYGNFNNFGDVTDSTVSQKRLSLMKQLNAYRIHIRMHGRTDYTIGQKVNLTLYKNQPIKNAESNTDLIDKVFSGNYLIAAINHSISREEHICTMEVVKESLMINLDKGI